MAVTMDQLREFIVEPHSMLPPCKRCAPCPPSDVFTSSYVRHLWGQLRCFARSPQVVDTLAYFWDNCRSGIFVSIRESKVKLFVPFCNPEYVNKWSDAARSQLPQVGLRPDRWWCNGWMLCEKQSANVWGDHWVTTLLNMLQESCVTPGMVDCDFIINKKDTPVVRHDGQDPMNPFDVNLPKIVDPSSLLPVLSFYSSDDYADVCCPLPKDWWRLTGNVFAQTPAQKTSLRT